MSAPAVTREAWWSHVEPWLAAQPQQRVALAFVDPSVYPGHLALAALEHEWLGAAYGIREPHVAAGKLHWWAQELDEVAHGRPHHPLSRVLFAEARASALPMALWLAPVQAALAGLEAGTASDFATQLDASLKLHGALAALETAWWYGPSVPAARATRLAALGHLLFALRRLEDDAERERLALPMTRLARFGLDRGRLREDSAERTAAVRAQLDDLAQAWQDALRLPGPLSVFRALAARGDARLLRRARRAERPLAVLQRGDGRTDPGLPFAAWRAARGWHAAAG